MLADYSVNDGDSTLEIPDWAITLEKAIRLAPSLRIATAQSIDENLGKQFFVPNKPVPFEDFYLPFFKVAKDKLLATHKEAWEKLSEEAQIKLCQGLLYRLIEIGGATLIEEFYNFRVDNNSLKDLLDVQLSLNKNNQKYNLFIEKLLSDNLWSFFDKYSVLGRLLATVTDFWVSGTTKFLTHLTDNWQAINDNYSPQQSLQKVIACQCNLSDSHNRGQSVIIITFDTKLKLVYKPRDLSLEVGFYKLVDWYNERSQLPSLSSLKLLNYKTHGWSEYIAALPCEDEAEVKRFYQRSGILICLVHILAGQDFHVENLIARGEHPVLVDLEALLHSTIDTTKKTKKHALILAHKQNHESVIQTYIIPLRRVHGKDVMQVDIGGLGDINDDITLPTLVWRNVNTDSMKLDYEALKLDYNNAPVLQGEKVSAAKYVAEVLWGFRQMYDFLMLNKDTLLAENSQLQLLNKQNIRFLFRDTGIYNRILQQSYAPQVLQHGIDRSIALDISSRGFILTKSETQYWQILNAEIKSLEALDIPLFTPNSSSRDLQLSDSKKAERVLAEKSFDKVINNVKGLSESDREKQLYFIKSAFLARYIKKPQWSENISYHTATIADEISNNNSLLEAAVAIANSIESQAIQGEDNTLAWFGLDYKSVTGGFNFQPLNQINLADGNLGIALYFAALAKITGDKKWHDLVWQIINSFAEGIARIVADPIQFHRQIKIGGVNGLGTSAYGLMKIARLIDAPSLIPIAENILSLITLDRINNSTQLNVISGIGSTLLSLLGCWDAGVSNSSECLEKAIACGDYLLQHQAPPRTKIDPENLNYWRGISGIAYALLRLSKVTGDQRYLITAINAISLESQTIDKLNLHQAKIEVALGRLGGISWLDTPQIRAEIDRAISLIKHQGIWGDNNLFWGNCGRIEMLLLAAEKLEMPQLNNLITSWGNTIANDNCVNSYKLDSIANRNNNYPGFLHGMSGMGYQLLRIAQPQLLPSILIWE
ncbi:MAG: type 2 lanthipeptide synthetase LanM family protein [Pleurocapsa sp.]